MLRMKIKVGTLSEWFDLVVEDGGSDVMIEITEADGDVGVTQTLVGLRS